MNQEVLTQIKTQNNIINVVSEYLNLTKRGKNYWALCPFHEDSSPSMSVSEEKQIYKCFVCQAGGNVFNFVANYKQISFPEAVQELAEKVGITVQMRAQSESTYNANETELIALMKQAMNFFQYALATPEGKTAQTYLSQRRITQQQIDKFSIGFAPGASLITFLQKKHFQPEDLINASLANDDLSPFFHERIIFGIKNHTGDIVAYSARTMRADSKAKYLNSRESSLFHKSRLLYNYANAQKSIKFHKNVYLTEGFMDVIALDKIGVTNVVAIMGTALTNQHCRVLQNVTVNLFLDPDQAGFNSALKSIKILHQNQIVVNVINNPTTLDPDEILVKLGREKLQTILAQQVNAYTFLYNYYAAQFKSDQASETAQFGAIFIPLLKTANVATQDFYIAKIMQKWMISKQTILKLLQRPEQSQEQQTRKFAAPVMQLEPLPKPQQKPQQKIQRRNNSYWLLHSIAKKLELAPLLAQNNVNFPDPTLILIAKYYIKKAAGLKPILSTEMRAKIAEIDAYSDFFAPVETENEVHDLIRKINRGTNARLSLAQIKVQLNNPNVASQTKAEVLKERSRQRKSGKKD